MTDEHDTPSGGHTPEDTNGVAVHPPDPTHALLHEPPAEPAPANRWLTLAFMAVASLFIIYHTSVLLVHNLPSKGLGKGLQAWFNKHLEARDYFQATGNTQSWAMFAPNPHRSNVFMRVLVKDEDGEIFDLKHDIYGKRDYPYLFYDRMGKINRRIIDQKGYRRHYAAWVCRWWEETHDGVSAEEVQFVKIWTRIPPPEQVLKRFREKGNDLRYLGYNPMELKLSQREEDKIRCSTTRHGQLPNYLRRRYGFEEVHEGLFRGLNIRTWYQRREQEERARERGATLPAREDDSQ
jgi:hypothetical protein